MDSKLVLGIFAVCLIAVGIAAYVIANNDTGSNEDPVDEYEKVTDTGKVYDVGSVFVYDTVIIEDGKKTQGELTMTVLGFNPSGMLYDMQADENLAAVYEGGIVLSNDTPTGSDYKVLKEIEWSNIDTVYGKKKMSYTEYIEDGMTNKIWYDQYTQVEYMESSEFDGYSITLTLKDMDVVWTDYFEGVEPSEDLGSTLTYSVSYLGAEIGYDTVTVVTNPDKDGVFYTREIMYIEGEGVASLTYQPSSTGDDGEGDAEITGNTITIETVDGIKELVEIKANNNGAEMLVYADTETGTMYRMILKNMGYELILDYQGKSVDKFWEDEE